MYNVLPQLPPNTATPRMTTSDPTSFAVIPEFEMHTRSSSFLVARMFPAAAQGGLVLVAPPPSRFAGDHRSSSVHPPTRPRRPHRPSHSTLLGLSKPAPSNTQHNTTQHCDREPKAAVHVPRPLRPRYDDTPWSVRRWFCMPGALDLRSSCGGCVWWWG